ncbi:MAG: DUF1294 domain-containing protein [Lachnospiraceae bacterium]|jgi:uncharacterized membrane protein YsdA (DUF1294 family)
MKYILLYLLLINLFTFFLYGLDKYKARRDLWRIPEATLLLFAIAGGSVGALAGMYTFRHKTRKAKFRLGVPTILLVQIILFYRIFHG